MDGRRHPRILGIVNTLLRWVLWTVLGFIVAGVVLSIFLGYPAGNTAGVGWVFLTVICVLAIVYTLDELIAAVRTGPVKMMPPTAAPAVPFDYSTILRSAGAP